MQVGERLAQRSDGDVKVCRHFALGCQFFAVDHPPGRDLADQHFADLLVKRQGVAVGHGSTAKIDTLLIYINVSVTQ